MIEMIKAGSDGTTECYAVEDDKSERYEELHKEGFREFVPMPKPEDVEEGQMLEAEYEERNDRIVERWRKRVDKSKVETKIATLQEQLSSSDYKVIKSYEYALTGKPLPYDTESLHSRRQRLREQIAELKREINEDA
jgi:hypothetical protein